MIFVSANKKTYFNFDWESYKKYYPALCNQGYSTRDEFWWHYINIGEPNGYIYFDIYNKNLYNELMQNSIPISIQSPIPQEHQPITQEQPIHEIIVTCPRKTIYYYVDFVSKNTNRTGIQVVTIYLARQFIQCQEEFYVDIIL